MTTIMLRRLGLGTGTGYSAAPIACLVGNQESVVTIGGPSFGRADGSCCRSRSGEPAASNSALYEALSGPAAEDRPGSGPPASLRWRIWTCGSRRRGHARRKPSSGRRPVSELHTEDLVAPSGAVLDSIAVPRTRTSRSLRQRRPGQRLWVLLHAQFLLRGRATSGDDIGLVEDDYQRMAVLRREGHR